jgi:hypothetical protein
MMSYGRTIQMCVGWERDHADAQVLDPSLTTEKAWVNQVAAMLTDKANASTIEQLARSVEAGPQTLKDMCDVAVRTSHPAVTRVAGTCALPCGLNGALYDNDSLYGQGQRRPPLHGEGRRRLRRERRKTTRV